MKRIKNFARFLVDNGLLFEINRKVLHPLGYSLEVDMDDSNRSRVIFSGILDAESPEGFSYDEESFNENIQVLNSFMEKEGNKKIDNRKDILGYVVQEK